MNRSNKEYKGRKKIYSCITPGELIVSKNIFTQQSIVADTGNEAKTKRK